MRNIFEIETEIQLWNQNKAFPLTWLPTVRTASLIMKSISTSWKSPLMFQLPSTLTGP